MEHDSLAEINNNKSALSEFLKEIIAYLKENTASNTISKNEIAKQKIFICRKLKMNKIPTDIELLLGAKSSDALFLKKYLQTKPMRTLSGVAVVAVMSHPQACPHGKCIYCPGGINSSFGDVPQSYTGNEPATMRGIRNNYDSYLQVMSRLEQYIAIGQSPEKVEIIVLGGTFISFEESYQVNFIKDIYSAMNDFSDLFYEKGEFNLEKFKDFFQLPGNIQDEQRTLSIKSKVLHLKKARSDRTLEEEKERNECSMIKCVGLTLETKPDWGYAEQGIKMLEYGCTRVEIGIQTLNDDILSKINRGHTLDEAKKSIRDLKNLGFKLNFHLMTGLPFSNKVQDIDTFKELFDNPDFRPDMLKIYPTMVMPGTNLEKMTKNKEYVPIEIEETIDIISEGLRMVPEYCRVMRIQRDIPSKHAVHAIRQNNLRQMVSLKMKEKGYHERDIRAREIKSNVIKEPIRFEKINYTASGGEEYFVSCSDANNFLLGFARLRLPSEFLRAEINANTAIIRELHVYGTSLPLKGQEGNAQHKGIGKKLLEIAEQIAKENAKNKVLVISGVGVRGYYSKLGYLPQGPYMAKSI
jgi:elongator complex protein 3